MMGLSLENMAIDARHGVDRAKKNTKRSTKKIATKKRGAETALDRASKLKTLNPTPPRRSRAPGGGFRWTAVGRLEARPTP
jgi:hypothetical protein